MADEYKSLSPQSGKTYTEDGKVRWWGNSIDKYGLFTSMDEFDFHIHEGLAFFTGLEVFDVPVGGTYYILAIIPNDKDVHMKDRSFSVWSGQALDVKLEVFQGVGYTTPGTEIPIFNNDLNLTNESSFKHYTNPTGIDLTGATQITPLTNIIKDEKTRLSVQSTGNEYVFKRNTAYVLRITNNSIQTINMFFKWRFYEAEVRTND